MSPSVPLPFTANGRPLQAEAGQTLLQALLQAGIHVPHLCHDLRLERSNGSCGLCMVELGDGRHVKACQTPVQSGLEVRTATPGIETYRKLRLEQLLSDHAADCEAPCIQACPAGIDIQSYLRQVVNGNFEAALRVIKDRNPLPSVCGRVCPHPCEAACRRKRVDEAVGINPVKRFLADWDQDRETPWLPKPKAPTGRRIAIVGSGPSGLTAAWFSALAGHTVSVFERLPLPGGMLRYGIPEYRLPKATLDREIDLIRALGVEIHTGKGLGTQLRLEDLHRSHDAVYLAIGSWRATPLQIEGENGDGVWLGIDYLEAVTRGEGVPEADTVLVIGGGNTAIDCARTALRRGARKVQLLYRRTRDEMPAEPHEVEDALREGVEMLFLIAPERITGKTRKQVHALRMTLGEPDRSGRRRPVPVEGSGHVLEADLVIGAVGQSTHTGFLYNDLPLQLNRWGDLEVNPHTMQTSVPRVFAGGDCVTGPATVIQAIAAGRRAAEAMDALLTQGFIPPGIQAYTCSRGSLEDLPRHEFEGLPRLARHPMPTLPVDERRADFRQVELGLGEAEARKEAARCLRCGCSERYRCELRIEATAHGAEHRKPLARLPHFPLKTDHPFIIRDHNKCIACGRCVAACSEIEGADVLGLYLRRGKMLVGTKSGQPLEETDCVSCGQCVTACPCGALTHARERGRVFRALNDPDTEVIGFVAPAVRSLIASYFQVPVEGVGPFLAGLLKRLGFDRVFDFTFAADLTIVEETSEFLERLANGGEKGHLPQFTSCCPAWVNGIERRYPDLIPHLSTCKSPQQMMGALVKHQLPTPDERRRVVVSVVPCLAKKYEARRPEFAPEGIPDVDAVLTTTELIEMVELARLDVREVVPADFDEPFRRVSGAGMLFGVSGGVAEAALRMAAERLTGQGLEGRLDFTEVRGLRGFKEAEVRLGERTLRLAVINGLNHAYPVMDRIAQGQDVGYDLIEVMACPGGCVGGAGHPVPEHTGELAARAEVLLELDRTSPLRKSHENPDVMRLYDTWFGSANSTRAHQLLHTHFQPRCGDAQVSAIRDKAASALDLHRLEICFCDTCQKGEAGPLFDRLETSIRERQLDAQVDLRPIRMAAHGEGGPFATLNGRTVGTGELQAFLAALPG